jgi:large subunit ribosomal protein L30e
MVAEVLIERLGWSAVNSRLALTIKSGKYSLGYKSSLKAMRSGKGQSRIL